MMGNIRTPPSLVCFSLNRRSWQLQSAVVLGPTMTHNPAVSWFEQSLLFFLFHPPIISSWMFLERTTKADRSFSPLNNLIVAAFLPADVISGADLGSLEVRNGCFITSSWYQ